MLYLALPWLLELLLSITVEGTPLTALRDGGMTSSRYMYLFSLSQ